MDIVGTLLDPEADLASVAALIADRNRAQMLLALLCGVPQSGSALAEAAGISRSLASAHLKKLVAGGFVRMEPNGRQRLFSIASEPVANALEILILLVPATPARSLREVGRVRNLRWARMCYDHLGGIVAVAVIEALIGHDLIREQDGGFVLGARGAAGFGELGIDVSQLEQRTRPLLRPCLDWSERRYHLAGSLGAALTATMLARRWIAPREASRVVTVHPAGVSGLRDWLNVDLDRLRAAA
jgi:DNA-binding transcriptional ArsR family regulator